MVRQESAKLLTNWDGFDSKISVEMTGPAPKDPQIRFEELLHDGILAVKTERRSLAQSLLQQAVLMNSADARPYLWLAETTDDPAEQRDFLEQAVARDPNDVAARRKLALLTGKLDAAQVLPEGSEMAPRRPAEAEEARSEAFMCPKCGGHMSYNIQAGRFTCEFCGYTQAGEAGDSIWAADRAEQVLDFVMPTSRGHRWAEAHHRLGCAQCGAVSLLPPGTKSLQCPYCGSNQMVDAAEDRELIDPQVIAPFKVNAEKAQGFVRAWLGRGLFAPDDLRQAGRYLKLRPAYYSCWTFDGNIEANWNCEVKISYGRYTQWEARSGIESRFFDDELVSGVKALSENELASIEPFKLKELKEFKPEYLAGWPAIVYDRSLSDASLKARERVTHQFRLDLNSRIEMGKEKRNFQISRAQWSAMTFKHVLLPLWIGTYRYQGKEFHLLLNGQTGKVGGKKPRDTVKTVMAFLIGAALLVFLVLVLTWLMGQGGYRP
jgi:ribosomal protein L37AE/L43A